jgi:hypothetical protein
MTADTLKQTIDEASRPLAVALAATPERPRSPHLTLYSAAEALSILDDLIAEHAAQIEARGGDIEAIPEIAELLSFAENGFEQAVERWCLKIRSLVAEAEGIRVEAQRLAVLQRQKENAAVKLKDYLRRHMEARGCTKVATPLVTARIQKNGGNPSVTAISETLIEELFVSGSPFAVQKIEYGLATNAIIAAHKNGEEIPEGIIVARGTHLRVE